MFIGGGCGNLSCNNLFSIYLYYTPVRNYTCCISPYPPLTYFIFEQWNLILPIDADNSTNGMWFGGLTHYCWWFLYTLTPYGPYLSLQKFVHWKQYFGTNRTCSKVTLECLLFCLLWTCTNATCSKYTVRVICIVKCGVCSLSLGQEMPPHKSK